MARNQHRTASTGRDPQLRLERGTESVALTDWGAQVLDGCAPIAQALDALQHTDAHAQALALARARLANPALTPSARVLASITAEHGGCFRHFGRSRSTFQAWKNSCETVLRLPRGLPAIERVLVRLVEFRCSIPSPPICGT